MTKHSDLLPLRQVQIKRGFWRQKIDLIRNEVIPYQWKALNDEIADAEPSYCMRNYRIAGKIIRGETERKLKKEKVFQPLPEIPDKPEETFYGFAFQDSDFSKWVEAVAYSLVQFPDEKLEKLADEAIDLVCQAQQEDGYLDTYFIIRNPAAIFTDLRDYHELYCFGHLAEGAVAYYQATGKDKLLKATERYASYIAKRIGPEEGQLHGYPGHELAEMALLRLYEETGEQKYLDLAVYFLNERGKRPYYFDQEHLESVREQTGNAENIDFSGKDTQEEKYQYQQAHRPVRQQDEAVGHAVRAVYLYSAMADAARLTGDTELFDSCETLWKNITEKKMYVTGGIGGTHIGESFSHEYDLPADTAYAETCAAIGLVFFARRMLQYQPKSYYADVMERALYNGVLSGMALDGKSFFYVNPLESRPRDCEKDARKHHVRPVRQKWFGCACCPPNLARLISSIGMYAFTRTEHTLFIHFLMDASIDTDILNADGKQQHIQADISGNLPWDGSGSIHIHGLGEDEHIQLALRVPEWTGAFQVNGQEYSDISQWKQNGGQEQDGYLLLDVCGDSEITFSFSMPVRFICASQKVREAAGQLTVMRGPIVYCLEEADNGSDLHLLHVGTEQAPTVHTEKICDEEVVTIETAGYREAAQTETALYREYTPAGQTPVSLKWIPYYAWANRGENEMRVWCER